MATIIAVQTPFDLQSLEGFPYDTWSNNEAYYLELEAWYKGLKLTESVKEKSTGKDIEKYPIKINPLKGTCEKHVAALFGNNVDSIQIGGIPVRILADTGKKIEKTDDGKITDVVKEETEKAIQDVFEENGAGGMFLSNGIISQYLSGCVFAASWIPEEKSESTGNQGRILISNPSPKEFIGIPQGTDYWNLSKAWIVRQITKEVAETYNVGLNQNDQEFWYIEEWTTKKRRITINGRVVNDDNDKPLDGDHPFGCVPIVYIPHVRVDRFLGESVVTEMVKGIIREMNLRWADAGDAVNDDAHTLIAIKNVRGKLEEKYIGGRPVVDLGSSSGLGAGESNPDMQSVPTKSAADVMIELGKELYILYRRETNHPAVADGEDSGSQRSSLSLGVKMWPLVAHVEMERVFWSLGVVRFCKILLKMMALKKVYKITEEHAKAKLKIVWAPMLPIDRKALIDELAIRCTHNLGSDELLMSLLGDIPNIEEEKKKILAQKKEAIALLPKPVAGRRAGEVAPSSGGSTAPPKKNTDTPNTPPKKPVQK